MTEQTIQLTGFTELAAALRELPQRVAKNALRAAVNAGASVIKKQVVQNAPEDTGLLKKEIYQKQIREKSGDFRQTYFVGVRTYKMKYANTRANRRKSRVTQAGESLKTYDINAAFYWRYVEFGTSKMTAKPFIRPAFEAKKEDAVEAIRTKLDERIQKYARELHKK